jgi:hypothetical protein
MPGNAIIIVPSQGDSINAFDDVARQLNQQVYGGTATIVKTTLTESGGSVAVTFQTLRRATFSWDTTHDISTVLTISHATGNDGPNLALGDESINVLLHQPWGMDPSDPTRLSPAAQTFWASVGRAMNADGKIILLGCNIGTGGADAYAGRVAAVTGKKVYAATAAFAAGNTATAVKHVRAIEGQHPKPPMKEFSP